MKPTINLLSLVFLAGVALTVGPNIKISSIQKSSRIESVQTVQAAHSPVAEKKAIVEAPKAPEPTPPPLDPNGCEAKGMWYRADNKECIAKPAPVAAPTVSYGSGSCEAEIAKYDWNQSVALAVARAESGLKTWIVNNNPDTRDYSVGCFQVNIYGANARNRPSEAALKDAATNVRFAYGIYVANGRSFIGQWGVCGSKVSCY